MSVGYNGDNDNSDAIGDIREKDDNDSCGAGDCYGDVTGNIDGVVVMIMLILNMAMMMVIGIMVMMIIIMVMMIVMTVRMIWYQWC